jgi:hypothetical protein
MIERTEEGNVSSIEIKLVGPLPEVLDAIEQEMERYDPRGYGTKVEKIWWHPGGTGALHVEARMWRAKSCD